MTSTDLTTQATAYDVGDINRPAGARWVVMSNALTRASHNLTLTEKRIIAAGLSKLDSRAMYNPLKPPITRLTAQEYADIFGLDVSNVYEQLQAGALQLYNRSIHFFEPTEKRYGEPIKPKKSIMRWVGRATYTEKEGWIELAWWPEILPHVMALRARFTKYQLEQASALRSVYSWRLLELLMRFESTGWAEYSIEDFSKSMEATEKQKANFNNIKRRIIEPAVKELTEKDGWLIQWEPIKAGRKVKAVRFKFERNPQTTIFE